MMKIYHENILTFILSCLVIDIDTCMFTVRVTSFSYCTTGSIDLHPGCTEYYVAEI